MAASPNHTTALSPQSAILHSNVSGVLAVCLVSALAYWTAISGQLNWILDDDALVTNNRLVHASDGLYRMWFTTEPTDYWPLTSSTFWLEWRLFGPNPTGYHVVNLLLHIAACLLLWRILDRLAIPGGFWAALLFAVHPVNVESVAWVAQRKNTLAMLFYLLSVLWYLRADEQTKSWNRWYWLSLAAFLLAMLSKGSVAILPLVLLLLTWWRRPLTKTDLVRTAPFFLLAGVLTLVNIWFQTHGADLMFRKVTPIERLLGAGAVIWFYLYKAFLPIQLQFFYPKWQIDAHQLRWWLPLFAAVLVSMLLWSKRHTKWGKATFIAWTYFCICLIPVMGFTDVGYMKYSLVADHYQHLAIIGVVALIAAAAATWTRRQSSAPKRFIWIVSLGGVALLGWLTFQQCELYRDVDTLYESSLAYSWMAQSSLGSIYLNRGQVDLARMHYQEALRLNETDKTALVGMSLLLSSEGRFADALQYARRSIELWPDDPDTHNELGIALKRTGHLSEAIEQYQEAIRLDREYAFAYNNLGIALADLGKLDQAIDNYKLAIKYQPHYVEAHNNLGVAMLKGGQIEGAIEQCREALRLNSDLFEARKTLGQALLTAGKPAEALDQLVDFVARFPNDAEAWTALVVANDELGRTAQARAAAEKGLAAARTVNNQSLVRQLEQWLKSVDGHQSPPDANK